MIAFIAGRLSEAITDIRNMHDVLRFNSSGRGEILTDGKAVSFVIVSTPDKLRGLTLTSYEFLPSAEFHFTGAQRAEIELIAQSRIR